jgi:hypothetical protein
MDHALIIIIIIMCHVPWHAMHGSWMRHAAPAARGDADAVDRRCTRSERTMAPITTHTERQSAGCWLSTLRLFFRVIFAEIRMT